VLYPTWSNYQWHQQETVGDSPEAMVGRLARRLEREPDDLNGWLMLGRSYGVIGQHELAARAYQRADSVAGGDSAEALIGQAEALIRAERSDLDGHAGRLFERAMQADPTSVKALFYSAFAARFRNELPLARQRFETLLQANPPAEVGQIIDEQLQEIDALARMAGADGAAAAGGSSAMAAVAPSTPGDSTAAVTVPLRVTLAPAVAGSVVAGAPLFVVARIPGQPGPPLAARRLEASFPQEVDLLST